MTAWIETYRGAVNPWECDIVEHFTVAYYFDRFGDATLALMDAFGVGPAHIKATRRACATVACDVSYQRELRVGDVFHIESAITDVGNKTLKAGHRVIDSVTGETITTLHQTLVHFDVDARKSLPFAADMRQRFEAGIVDWQAPDMPARPDSDDLDRFMPAYRDTTKPWEVDALGHIGFQFYVHRFSAAGGQLQAAMGLTPAFMREQRRGMSTFEFQLQFFRELNAGELVAVRSAVTHLGGSSFCFLHKLVNLQTGEIAASLSQFAVLLDLDARRPTRLPDAVREQAAPLVLVTPS
jgi:acyl-CoA thioesterase FadM